MKLPFFNWSLKKLIESEQGTFNIARIRILYIMLIFALLKIVITMVTAIAYDQSFQLKRAVFSFIIYLVFFKLLLAGKRYIYALTHLMTISGLLILISILFISAQKINVITMQFVFMVILCSFYLLNRKWGIIYTILAVLPLFVFQVFFEGSPYQTKIISDELAYPGQVIIMVLNFLTFTVAHYLYREAFSQTIEEKELLNMQLQATLGEAKRLAKSKSDFLSTMSHELRTPLNMVIGMTELLRDTPHDEEQEENLRLMNFAAVNLHALINDILDFNKIDSGKLELEKININTKELMHSIISGMEMQANEKGLDLLVDVDPRLHKQGIVTDPIRLSQIIYNLVGNGIKFTNKGKVTLSLKVKEQSGNQIRVQFMVKDTGIGISKEKRELIFEPFIQASSNTTRNYGGTGLGLSIVKQLLEVFDSQIFLESTPGEGSTFFFDIIFSLGEEFTGESKPTKLDVGGLEGLKLLIAEDNPLNTFLIKKLCTKWGVLPTIVQNGLEVIDAIDKGDFNIILMDLHMPELDGYEASRAIRQLANGSKEKLTIIALTASVSHNLDKKVAEAGMDDFMRKPFNANELYAKLRKCADKYH